MTEETNKLAEKQWYIATTYSGHEQKAAENIKRRIESMNLKDYVFRIVVAEEQIQEKDKDGKLKTVKHKETGLKKTKMKTIEVVAAVIRHEDKIFATQRGYGDFEGGWEFPGGKMEAGETPQEALVREIMEELDTEIEVGDLIDTVEYDYPKFHLKMHCFFCTIKSGHLVLKEHEAAKWLTLETLDSVAWLPADQGLIEKIRTVLTKKA